MVRVQMWALLVDIVRLAPAPLITKLQLRMAPGESSIRLGAVVRDALAALPTDRRCDNCAREGIQRCKACGCVVYCDVVCQRQGWTHHHRRVCGKYRELLPLLVDFAYPEIV